MTKGSSMRKQRGQVQVRSRTKPTTGNLGPRDPGPHGKSVKRLAPASEPVSWYSTFLATMRKVGAR